MSIPLTEVLYLRSELATAHAAARHWENQANQYAWQMERQGEIAAQLRKERDEAIAVIRRAEARTNGYADNDHRIAEELLRPYLARISGDEDLRFATGGAA